jgi:hypothetical protein
MKFVLGTLLAAFLCTLQYVVAAELKTPNFNITVTSLCEEGNVSCDKITYVGVNRKTGASIKLKGRTHHTTCADGTTPCKFLGYVFNNGNIQYFVSEDGYLLVTRNNHEVLLREKGKWRY